MSLVHDTPNALIIGICVMKMFEKAGWLLTCMFDCLIDVNIDPGEITKNPDHDQDYRGYGDSPVSKWWSTINPEKGI